MKFNESIKEFKESIVKGEIVKSGMYSLLTSAIFLLLVYYLSFRNISGFSEKYLFPIILVSLSYAIIVPIIKQVREFNEFPCMSGMMIGMTFGMLAGFLPGFFVASTNGMFIGSVFGIIVGIVLGIWNGNCSGIMGIMEGTMAGFMGGLMGAMTAFMLLNDHLKVIGIVCFAVSAIIALELNYMIYKEAKLLEKARKKGQSLVIIITLILISLTSWIMIFGPKTGLFGN